MTFINVGPIERRVERSPGPCTTAVEDRLAATRLLAGMQHEVLATLASAAVCRRYADGDTLFYEGDEARHCLLVVQGAVEVLRYDAAGDERMLHCFEAGQWVADAAMFMPHGLYPMTARAQGETEVWRFSRRTVRGACERYPALALRLLESLSLRMYRLVNQVDWLTSSKATQRLAAYLVALAGRQGPNIELPTSQRHLAAHLGIRAETLNRILAEWQGKGWISGGRRLWCLLDIAPLRSLAASAARAF